jgi:hypothetical protein
MMDLRSIALALNGVVSGRQVLAPGPGHSPQDRSLAIRPSPEAPDGFEHLLTAFVIHPDLPGLTSEN